MSTGSEGGDSANGTGLLNGGLAGLAGLAARAMGAVAGQAQRRVPPADLDERDPDYIREDLPGLWMLASLYFRADVRGLDEIPAAGPVLLVGNHSGER